MKKCFCKHQKTLVPRPLKNVIKHSEENFAFMLDCLQTFIKWELPFNSYRVMKRHNIYLQTHRVKTSKILLLSR